MYCQPCFWISFSVFALIIPRSATMHIWRIPNRFSNRFTTGTRVVTSVVLPGQNSLQTGLPSLSKIIPTTICFKSGRWSFDLPLLPRASPPSPSKYILVVSKNTRSSFENKSLRLKNSCSSILSFWHRGENGVAPSWAFSGNGSPIHPIAR